MLQPATGSVRCVLELGASVCAMNLPDDCLKQTFLVLLNLLTRAEVEVIAPSRKTGAALAKSSVL